MDYVVIKPVKPHIGVAPSGADWTAKR